MGSHHVLRHLVQTLPLWVAVVLGARRFRVTGWVALPLFLFWLVLMVFIRLYLLGISNMLSGHFTPLEIAMTIVVGAASVPGMGAFISLKSLVISKWHLAGIFVILAAAQFVCFRLSFLPAIVHR